MSKILSSYVFREIFIPTVLAVVTLTFIILVRATAPWDSNERLIFTFIKLLLRDDTSKLDVLGLFALVLPSFLLFVTPMALLVGLIVGVGRMTLDLEIRAMQTSGINLLSVFVPVIVFAALLSALTAYMSYGPEPRMLQASAQKGAQLFIKEITNLEPGRVYQSLLKSERGMHFYFDGREQTLGTMKGVSMLIERKSVQSSEDRKKQNAKKEERLKSLKELHRQGVITRMEYDRAEHNFEIRQASDPPIMIMASNAQFVVEPDASSLQLQLLNGSLHMLERQPGREKSDDRKSTATPQVAAETPLPKPGEKAPDAAVAAAAETRAEIAQKPNSDQQYAILNFKRLVKNEPLGGVSDVRKPRTMTIPELKAFSENSKQKAKRRMEAKAAILQRYAFSLQSLVYAIIGLPLAIWIKPTGKSIGIVLAAAIIFVYHLLLKTGSTMVESSNPLGPLMVFMPNILFAAAGAWLWWRALRR